MSAVVARLIVRLFAVLGYLLAIIFLAETTMPQVMLWAVTALGGIGVVAIIELTSRIGNEHGRLLRNMNRAGTRQ